MKVDFSERISFHDDDEVVEIDLTDVVLDNAHTVDDLQMVLERALAPTGRKWFFLINYLRSTIYPEAWIAFANVGRKINLTYSLGTVRFNTPEETQAAIEDHAEDHDFDPNIAPYRDAAYAEILALRESYYVEHPPARPVAPELRADFERRVVLHPDLGVAEADFSDLSFPDGRTVDAFYDIFERKIDESGRRRWYFLVNYRDCGIDPSAWVTFAHRGKRANVTHSLGSVRYAACEDTAAEIGLHAEVHQFDQSLFPSRDAALAEIERMKGAADQAPRFG